MLIIHVCDDIRELVCVFCVREYASCVRVGTLMSLYAHSPPRVRQDLSIFSRDQQFVSNWKEDICSLWNEVGRNMYLLNLEGMEGRYLRHMYRTSNRCFLSHSMID